MWIREGIFKQTCDPNLPGQYEIEDYCVYKYNIGFSVILIPFVALDLNSTFIANFLFFIGSVILFSELLKFFRIQSYFIYFFAFFPSFVFYSRTNLSEISSLFFTLAFTWSLLNLKKKKKKVYLFSFVAGLSLGVSIFIKYTNVVHLTAILGILYYKELVTFNFKRVVAFCLGFIPLLLLIALINIELYKGPFNSGYFYADEQVFSISYFINHFWKYIVALTIFYPLSLPLGLYKNKLAYLAVPLFLSIIAYSSSKNNLFEGRVLDLVFGIRFILPVLPFLFLPYFSKLQEYMKFKPAKIFTVLSIIILVIGTFCLNFSHWRYLREEHTDEWINVSEYIEEKGL